MAALPAPPLVTTKNILDNYQNLPKLKIIQISNLVRKKKEQNISLTIL